LGILKKTNGCFTSYLFYKNLQQLIAANQENTKNSCRNIGKASPKQPGSVTKRMGYSMSEKTRKKKDFSSKQIGLTAPILK
jgi:hypothetical protein